MPRRWAIAIAVGLFVLMFIVLAILATEPDPATTTTSGPPIISPTSSTAGDEALDAFDTRSIAVSGEEWTVAVAAEPHERVQGLMFVTDLGDLDGMLFVWEEDTTTEFWMKNTPLPLDIAFFSADGTLVDIIAMEPCETDPCPLYAARAPYRYALEAPTGAFDEFDEPKLGL